MPRPRNTQPFTVRALDEVYLYVEFLKKQYPRKVSHSKVYYRGFQATVQDFTDQGIPLPEDPTSILLSIIQKEREELDLMEKNILESQKKQKIRSPNTLSGTTSFKRLTKTIKDEDTGDTIVEDLSGGD